MKLQSILLTVAVLCFHTDKIKCHRRPPTPVALKVCPLAAGLLDPPAFQSCPVWPLPSRCRSLIPADLATLPSTEDSTATLAMDGRDGMWALDALIYLLLHLYMDSEERLPSWCSW